jgi:hypothetical protein
MDVQSFRRQYSITTCASAILCRVRNSDEYTLIQILAIMDLSKKEDGRLKNCDPLANPKLLKAVVVARTSDICSERYYRDSLCLAVHSSPHWRYLDFWAPFRCTLRTQ